LEPYLTKKKVREKKKLRGGLTEGEKSQDSRLLIDRTLREN